MPCDAGDEIARDGFRQMFRHFERLDEIEALPEIEGLRQVVRPEICD